MTPDSQSPENFDPAYIAQRAPHLVLPTVVLAFFQPFLLFSHPRATTMAVSAAFRGEYRPKGGKLGLYGKPRTSAVAYRKPKQVRRSLWPSKRPACQQHRPTSWILMLLTSWPFRRPQRPADLLRLSVSDGGGPGLSIEPSFATFGAVLPLECRRDCHGCGWRMEIGQKGSI